MSQPLRDNSRAFHSRRVLILLAAVYLLVRLPNLNSQPIFADEATYLRWAQLIAKDPLANALVSMRDAKLPLHYWLLAATRWLNADPLVAGRTLSVVLGGITLWALLALCDELLFLRPSPSQSFAFTLRIFAGTAFIFSPLLSFYQRMALAEPLLVLETVLMAMLSLRLARRLADAPTKSTVLRHAIPVGLVWGGALITKQNFSYLLGGVPLIAFALHARVGRGYLRRASVGYVFAAMIAAAIFVPVLFGDATNDLRTRLFYKPVFTGGDSSRLALLWQNLVHLLSPRADGHPQWWPHDPTRPLTDGLLYLFLTPPVLLMSLLAPPLILVKPAGRRAGAFMSGFILLIIGPLLLTGNVLFSRFLCMATVALLLPVAWMLAAFITQENPPSDEGLAGVLAKIPRPARIALAVATLLWPALATVAGARDSQAPILAAADRSEFLGGSSSGTAARHAIAYLEGQAATHPITVITGPGLCVYDDAAWVFLADNPNIRLYSADNPLSLAPISGQPNTYALLTEQWLPGTRRPIRLNDSVPIYALGAPPDTAATMQPKRPDEPAIAAEFFNPAPPRPGDAPVGVVLYRLFPANPPDASKSTTPPVSVK